MQASKNTLLTPTRGCQNADARNLRVTGALCHLLVVSGDDEAIKLSQVRCFVPTSYCADAPRS